MSFDVPPSPLGLGIYSDSEDSDEEADGGGGGGAAGGGAGGESDDSGDSDEELKAMIRRKRRDFQDKEREILQRLHREEMKQRGQNQEKEDKDEEEQADEEERDEDEEDKEEEKTEGGARGHEKAQDKYNSPNHDTSRTLGMYDFFPLTWLYSSSIFVPSLRPQY